MLFVGDDWAEDHHDVEILDEAGKKLARARLPEGVEGISRLHALLAGHLEEEWLDPGTGMLMPGRVLVGIETDRGGWVQALLAAGYDVYAINPMQVARYRERHSTSGAKSDLLTELPDRIVRLSPGVARGLARLPGYGPRRGCTTGVVVVGGAAAGVA